MALIDEVHEHRVLVVVNKMRAGTKGRRQALVVVESTQRRLRPHLGLLGAPPLQGQDLL